MAASAGSRCGGRGDVLVGSGGGFKGERRHPKSGTECPGLPVSRGAASAAGGFGGSSAGAASGPPPDRVEQNGGAAAVGGNGGDGAINGAVTLWNRFAIDGMFVKGS